MKRVIPCLYSEYGRYTDALRAIPYKKDLLKPVERRVLLSLYDLARTKLKKCARIVGDCIGKYHPHGDQSTYGVLINLIQRGFAEGQGNVGGPGLQDSKYAAYRYTEARLKPEVAAFAFELYKFGVPWEDPENLQEQQPLFLPSPVPLGLIGSGNIHGISFNTTRIPRYTLPDLIKRLNYLLKSEVDPTTPIETIIPNIQNCNVYEFQPGEYEKILTTGEGKIYVIPKITIDKHGVHIWGKPPTGLSQLEERADSNNYDVTDLTSKGVFEVLVEPRDRIVNQPFVDMIHKIITTKLRFICNVVEDDGTVVMYSIDRMIRECYDQWVTCLETKYKYDIDDVKYKIFQHYVIEVVRDIIAKNNVNYVDDIVKIFQQNYAHQHPSIQDSHIREVCSRYTIRALVEFKTDVKSLQVKEQNLQAELNNIAVVAYNKMCKMVQ